MIQTILILLLIHYIGLYIFKPKHNTLNCGLFGWSGKDVKKFNKDKFDKLGILNVERGKSSCGISFDGDIQIGIDANKMYYDFIIDREIKLTKYPIIIGHTRQSSVGSVNVFNAHPFGFGDNNNDFIFIGAHNGTLKNHKELAKKYEVDESVENYYTDKDNKEIVVKRDKIDSEILLEIIYKHKNFKVLSEYIGGAALVFTDTTNPNVLYLFKGKSKDWGSSAHESTERPLFVYIENKNSMYFSSLEDSLRTIGGNDDNVIDIESNVVYKITDGDFKNAELIPVTRINATQNISYNNTKNYGPNYGLDDESWYGGYGHNSAFNIKKEEKEEKSTTLMTLPAVKNVKEKTKEVFNIYNETLSKPHDEYQGVPYFNKLRWYRNGQLITGIYVWINEYGYYPVGHSIKTANEKFNFILDKLFDGKEFIGDDGKLEGIIPFKSSSLLTPAYFYFVQGVQIKTFWDYASCYNMFEKLKPGNHLDYIQLSQVSTHPIINLQFSTKAIDEQMILKNGLIYDGNFTCLGAEKNYEVKRGNLINETENLFFKCFKKDYYKVKKKEDKNSIKLALEFDNFDYEPTISEKDVILEQNDDEMLENMVAQEEEENQMIKSMCEEDFTEPIKDFQQIRTKLFNNFLENTLAIKVVSFIDNALEEMKEFIN